jgi:hypothetical protein
MSPSGNEGRYRAFSSNLGTQPALSAWETSSQHYYDSRGVARIYPMSLNGGGWKLWRGPDFW